MFIYYLLTITLAALPKANLSIGPLLQSQYDDEDQDQIVYVNGKVHENFDLTSFPSLSCCPNNVTKFRVMNLNAQGPTIQRFNLPFYIENLGEEPLLIEWLNITEELSDQDIQIQLNYTTDQPIIFGFDNYLGLNITHLCYKKLNNDKYWSMKRVSLQFVGFDPVIFNYQFLCGKDYYPVRFDWSNIILIFFESVIILVLSMFGKIYAFKVVFITKKLKKELPQEKLDKIAQESSPFQGFSLSWSQALFYMILLLGALFISLQLQKKAEIPIQALAFALCVFCTIHFIDELFCAFRKQIPFFVKLIFYIRYCDIFALILGVGLFAIYMATEQIWILSNLISICILGSLIKLLKITSLKHCLLFFLPIMAMDIFCSIYLAINIRYEWDSLILRYFNTPLSAQIPYFRFIYKKKCAWVSIFNILFPGFFLGYVHRFDRLKKTFVYEIVSFFGLLIGLVLWVIIQFLISFPLPTSIFTEVLMVLTCTLIAFRRNELNLFWTGNFYDEILLNPFKNEMDKKSIKLISFFNIGVSQELKKKYALNSGVEETANAYEPFELVKANQNGDLKLDSILFEGLQSFQDIYSSPNQTFRNNDQILNKQQQNTIETQKQQDIQTGLKENKVTSTEDPIIQNKQSLNNQEIEPLIQNQNGTEFNNKINENPSIEQPQLNINTQNQKNQVEEQQEIIVQQNSESIDVQKQKSLGKAKITFIENKKLEEIILETPKIQSNNNEQDKKSIKNDIKIEDKEQQKVQQGIQNQNSNQQNKVDQVQEKQNLQQNNKVYSSPARQKYQVNTQKAKEPEVDRFKQKQQLRQQNDNFKKNLEFFQNQEKAGNFKAPAKK
ncbi:unnamed protein product [Paramecium sonneborni]|uniref:Transmembrane protein n=1 Tax=Paramecium sonneborni TaxID=65129 RepID=A0A8S1QEZ4_9CILI|nr:unnamed protein product [Paramecium sonneborni]